jgi:hypothetical protein
MGHDDELVNDHIERLIKSEVRLDEGAREFKKINTKVGNVEKKVDHLQHTIGEKAITNGFTKEKLETLDKQDETMMEILIDTREQLLKYMERQEGIREGKQEKKLDKQFKWYQKINISNNKYTLWTGVIAIVIAIIVWAIEHRW